MGKVVVKLAVAALSFTAINISSMLSEAALSGLAPSGDGSVMFITIAASADL